MNDWRAIEKRLVDAARVCGHPVYKGTGDHVGGDWFIEIDSGGYIPEGYHSSPDINLTKIAREMAQP